MAGDAAAATATTRRTLLLPGSPAVGGSAAIRETLIVIRLMENEVYAFRPRKRGRAGARSRGGLRTPGRDWSVSGVADITGGFMRALLALSCSGLEIKEFIPSLPFVELVGVADVSRSLCDSRSATVAMNIITLRLFNRLADLST